MKWFGKNWDGMVCEPASRTRVPVNEFCWMCNKKFVKTDIGLVIAWDNGIKKPLHLLCVLRYLA